LNASAQKALQEPQCASALASYQQQHPGAPTGTTPSVYACSDFWSTSSFCCAIVNRGVVTSGSPTDACTFYNGADPFNSYSQWVHGKCPGIYAFPYDDFAGQSGFHQCNARELRITWCPGG
jgi:hypothetical protein